MPKARQKTGTLLPEQAEVVGLPEDVAAIRTEIRKFFSTKDERGKSVGSYKHGVYAFYDYDGEPTGGMGPAIMANGMSSNFGVSTNIS